MDSAHAVYAVNSQHMCARVLVVTLLPISSYSLLLMDKKYQIEVGNDLM